MTGYEFKYKHTHTERERANKRYYIFIHLPDNFFLRIFLIFTQNFIYLAILPILKQPCIQMFPKGVLSNME